MSAVTFADDAAICIVSRDPKQLAAWIATVMGIAAEVFIEHALTLNFKAGNSESVLKHNGASCQGLDATIMRGKDAASPFCSRHCGLRTILRALLARNFVLGGRCS